MSARYATAAWQSEHDGWLYRQQQWGEPSGFGDPCAFVSRGVIFARGWQIAAAVDEACGISIEQELAA